MSDDLSFPCPKDPPWPDGCGGGCYICYGHGVITADHVMRLARDAEDRFEAIDERDDRIEALEAETDSLGDIIDRWIDKVHALEAELAAERAHSDELYAVAMAAIHGALPRLPTLEEHVLAAHRAARTPTKETS